MPEYRYELRRGDEVIATGHLNRPLASANYASLCSSGVTTSRRRKRSRLLAARSTARTRSESRACGSRRCCWCGEGQLDRFAAARFGRVRLVAFVAGAFLRVGVGFATAGVCRCVFVAVVLAVSVTL